MFRSTQTLACALALAGSTAAPAALVVIDDFEINEGRFASNPSTSGTTQGETETAPGVGPSTADRSGDFALTGSFSERIFLDDDPAFDVAGSEGLEWRLRFLSGGGSPANNLALQVLPDTYVGFALLTTTPNLRASIFIDDGSALERATYIPIIADGQWHLYQWRLSDATQWEGFAGTGPNGAIDATTVTVDAIYIDAPVNAATPEQDAVFYIDYVASNDSGPIPVPEPSTAGLMALGIAGFSLARRRR